MRRFHLTLALGAALLAGPSVNHARSAEPVKTTVSQQTAKRFEGTRESLNLASEIEIMIDPRTGEVITSSGRTSSSTGSQTNSNDEPTASSEPVYRPYDFFDPQDTGTSSLNSYFLAQLSMGVYSTALTETDFERDLIFRFEPQGILEDNIAVRMHMVSGAEAAAFRIGDATVIAFRGTSAEGTQVPDADAESDLLDVPIKISVNNKECRVHQGFWESTDSIYDWVENIARSAHNAGRKVFLTGHSLGGARATVAAFRLHYEDNIPVQSLQTFGSPKVGDANFRAMFFNHGAGGVRLVDVTERFVVLGDPATTFPDKESIWDDQWKLPVVVYYEHVGNTHNILPLTGTNSSHYDIMFDSGEIFFVPTASQWIGFLSGAGDNEHMLYDDALLHEVINDPAYIELKDMLIEHESVEQ